MANPSFAALKARAQKSPLAGALTQANNSETKNYDDNRYWKLTRDKSGNGSAVIRFLDVCKVDMVDPNNLPFVKIYDHAFSVFQGKLCHPKQQGAKWYIEKSLSTFGEQDIVGLKNSELWNTGVEELKKIASARKRRLTYHSNILVINDPANPDNNGKVFLFRYGSQIAAMLDEAQNPVDDPLAETPVVGYNPFCFYNGADFVLKIRNKPGANTNEVFPSYDKSAFRARAPLFNGDDAKIEAVWERGHSLQELLDRKHFKTAEELEKRFYQVYAVANIGTAADAPTQESHQEDVPNFDSAIGDQSAPKPQAPKQDAAPAYSLPEDDEDDLQFFANLAKG